MKNNMVYIVEGIGVRNAMFNAAFDGWAKQDSEGTMYGSPQALEFAYKEQFARDGRNVLIRKRVDENGVMDYKETFEASSSVLSLDKKNLTNDMIAKILFTEYVDIVQFGTIFNPKDYKNTFGICGAVQIGFGINKYADTEELISEMLPPFSAQSKKESKSKKKEAESSEDEKLKSNTLGAQKILNKAHYIYDITINPYQYRDYAVTIDGFDGYTEEDYKIFKEASLKAVSNLNTKSKKGCFNEFALFVETKPEVRDSIDLNSMGDYISVHDDDDMLVYNLEKLAELLNAVHDKVQSIEIYYDAWKVKLVGDIEDAKLFNIKTKLPIEATKKNASEGKDE